MLTEYPYARGYLFRALEAQPELFEAALTGLKEDEVDFRPEADRFTIREVLAHLADWESIWLERMRRICSEDHPTLPGYDEGLLAVERDYASKDPGEQLRRFQEGRRSIVAFLRDRDELDWQRTGLRQEIGVLTLEALTLIIPLHDVYHLQQVHQWRNRRRQLSPQES